MKTKMITKVKIQLKRHDCMAQIRRHVDTGSGTLSKERTDSILANRCLSCLHPIHGACLNLRIYR